MCAYFSCLWSGKHVFVHVFTALQRSFEENLKGVLKELQCGKSGRRRRCVSWVVKCDVLVVGPRLWSGRHGTSFATCRGVSWTSITLEIGRRSAASRCGLSNFQ